MNNNLLKSLNNSKLNSDILIESRIVWINLNRHFNNRINFVIPFSQLIIYLGTINLFNYFLSLSLIGIFGYVLWV